MGDQVAAVAHAISVGRDELVGQLVETTRARIERLDFDWQMIKLLEASIAENVVSGLNYLANDIPLEAVSAPTSATSYARALAQRDIPLSALARSYRIGLARFLDVAMGQIDELRVADRAPTMATIVERSLRFIDKVVMDVEVAYEQERDRWTSSRGGLRQKWIGQILDGSTEDLAAAEHALGYRFTGIHVAIEVWPDDDVPARDVPTLFGDVARLLSPLLGSVAVPLLVPTGERQGRIWFSVADTREVDAEALAAMLDQRSKRVRLAVGLPAAGLDGFKRIVAQADRVHLIASEGGATIPRVLTYGKIAPLALLANDFDGLRAFVVRTLGDLAGPDPRNDWLRETLRIFLLRERSYSAAADEMARHRNTIQYRVQQAIELCGVDLDEPERALEVQIALYAAHWLGAAVLGTQTDQKGSNS